MSRLAWLSQDTIPSRRVRAIRLPDDELWVAQFLGAFLLLTLEESWEEYGALSSVDMADEWRAIFVEFINGTASMIPVGAYFEYGGVVEPDGFLFCHGQEVSRSTYADLFAVIGTRHGVGNGTTTFNLPDRRGRVGIGWSDTDADFNEVGNVGGAKTVTLTTAQIPSHNHTQDPHNHTQNSHNHTQDPHNHTQNSHNHTQNSHVHNPSGNPVILGASASYVTTSGSASVKAEASPGVVATNIAATAVNQATTPTNLATTATSIAATATNQATGGGSAHSNVQPYLVSTYIIKF